MAEESGISSNDLTSENFAVKILKSTSLETVMTVASDELQRTIKRGEIGLYFVFSHLSSISTTNRQKLHKKNHHFCHNMYEKEKEQEEKLE